MGVKLAAAEMAQVYWWQVGDSVKTESPGPAKRGSMHGWKRQDDWAPCPRTFCDGASCVGVEYISKHIVYNSVQRPSWRVHAPLERVEKIQRDPRHYASVQTQKKRLFRWRQPGKQ